jgi:iron complex outermembrane receptor protein
VTQSDGLSRTDINDPHAYEALDIIRGPSSARYDNYALGGVLNFRTRRGQDIDGLEIGNDFGSYGYQNHYLSWGGQRGGFGYSLFGSYIQGDGYLTFSNFNTATENILLTFAPDSTRSFAFKFINNNTTTNVPSRLSLDQRNNDPRSAGTTSLSVQGAANRTVTAQVADQSREDQRTIVGARYSQMIAEATTVTMTGTFDLKNIYQIFGTITDNQNPNYNAMLDVVREGTLFGRPVKHYIGGFFNYMTQDSSSLFNLGDSHGTSGGLQAQTRGSILNAGGRAREELTFAPGWTLALGLGGESSTIDATLRNMVGTTSYTSVNVNRAFTNIAPEAALIFQPTPNLTTHFRVGTGYGIPSISNLTTTPAGVPGNNTDLKAQENLGIELGIDARRLFGKLDLSLTGYYEWFKNEFVTQSPGAGLSNFTTNAPHSQHRGIEASAVLRPFAGISWWDGLYLRADYTFNDHFYTDFTEVINGVALNRDGKQMPGVEVQGLYTKLGYESHLGFGGWLTYNYLDRYWINNSNSLSAPSYGVVNLNLHWARAFANTFLRGAEAFFEVRNLLDTDYIESAVTVTDNVVNSQASNNTKQAFFTGAGRSFFGGLRLKF